MINGEGTIVNSYIAPNNIDSSTGDIIGGGKTFKGEIDLSQIAQGDFELTGIGVQTVGVAGVSSQVTIRQLDIRGAYETGDVDGDYYVNSNDARLALKALLKTAELTEQQASAADANADGDLTAADIRAILMKSVGLL